MNELVNGLSGFLWGYVLIVLLIGAGIFFTVRLGFIQFRHFGHTFSVLKNSRKSDKAGISSFQALSTSLAARVGVGNMGGVAVAIYLGGPGAVFWMWVIAIIGMATSFAESSLAQLYKVTDDDGNYRGGPAYYMEKGLNKRWMGVLFSVFLIIAFGLVFNAVQAGAIAQSMETAFGFEKTYVGYAIAMLSALIIFGGLRTIAKFAELVVPTMAVVYLAIALIVVAMNLSELPAMFAMIFQSAFGLQEAGAGALGAAIMNGVKRGMFSNEAGMGSAANAAATATPYPPHPASQGYVQMLGVFIDTIIICTATAAIILLSGQLEPGSGVTSIQLTQVALVSQVGDWGAIFIAIAIFFFAFTSIVANYSYAETNLIFLEHNHKAGLTVFRICVLAMVLWGATADVPLVWALADVSMGLMGVINIIAILLLSGVVIKLARDYNRQLDSGQVPSFDANEHPELKSGLETGIWFDKKNNN
ncbi:alanine/glycine:cation symporter family protein [Motilimonas pumila]|uniref:Alanine:cation symporter family protein n=1 Tax=Motilimonas pumila TaxID=2303987 RepID=A0A418YAN3_9GAMM|nr:sodium:alanine symporter family protein [Motilimonas pumila]RJG40020.1 alanine:cation symporter family protein [Motilimonas pumila]